MNGDRHLDWEGLANTRDLGGLPTRDGGRTRRGVFVRSECPDRMGEAGWRSLVAHGITTCVDLRSSWEVDERPCAPPLPGIAVVAAPLEDGLLADVEFLDWATSGLLGTALYYAPYLARWPERAVAAVAAVAEAPGGVLFHCQRGRDRTGLVALLLLAAAGVPDEVIVADVIASDARLAVAAVDRTPDEVAAEDALYAARGTTAEATLTALLADLDVASLLPSPTLATVRARLVG